MKKFLSKLLYSIVFGKPRQALNNQQPDLSRIRRIMVVRNDNIGDLICSFPVFEALKKTCSQAEITLVGTTYNSEVAEKNPYIDRILCYPKHKNSNSIRLMSAWRQYKFLKDLRKYNFDLAIGLRSHFSLMQALIVFASGAPYRLGHYPKRLRYRHLSFFYNIFVPISREKKHELCRSMDVIKTIGINIENPHPTLVINRSDKDFAKKVAAEKKLYGSCVIGYHISNRKSNLTWPLASFAELIFLLKQKYPESKHLITFAPDQRDRADRLRTLLSLDAHIIETPKIKDLAALLGLCRLFITLDGAPMHLSAAIGIPTLAIFPKENILEWYPWGEGHRVVTNDEGITAISPHLVFKEAVDMLK